MKKKCLIIISLVIFGSLCLLNFKLNNGSTKNIIGVYVNDEYSDNVPAKYSGYYVDKIECDSGSSGEWDYISWGLLTTNMSKKSKCNVYFRKDTVVEAIKNELDTTGKCPTVNSDGTVNVTGAESENSLLCKAPDNYGTSYYYRGNVQNNYVYFANFYWRIVRINGDGSIRMIYDGTSAHENGEASGDRIIGNSAFNEKIDDNAYVGYMYGTPGSLTYEETHANINDSTIKKYIDKWYEEKIVVSGNSNYVADSYFCNDRRLTTLSATDYYNDLGYGANSSRYYLFDFQDSWSSKDLINLQCFVNRDTFTVNDKKIGNATLKYPIALTNISEVVLAGGYGIENNKYFFYIGGFYWTMSPSFINNNRTLIYGVYDNGRSAHAHYADDVRGVKPVINLKQGSLKSGNGTINNPYRIN